MGNFQLTHCNPWFGCRDLRRRGSSRAISPSRSCRTTCWTARIQKFQPSKASLSGWNLRNWNRRRAGRRRAHGFGEVVEIDGREAEEVVAAESTDRRHLLFGVGDSPSAAPDDDLELREIKCVIKPSAQQSGLSKAKKWTRFNPFLVFPHEKIIPF